MWNGDLEACRADGSDFIAQVSASVVKDASGKPICLMVSLVDVTESRRIHEILNRKQKNLEAIFDATPLGMLLVNDAVGVPAAPSVSQKTRAEVRAELMEAIANGDLQALNSDNSFDGRAQAKRATYAATQIARAAK